MKNKNFIKNISIFVVCVMVIACFSSVAVFAADECDHEYENTYVSDGNGCHSVIPKCTKCGKTGSGISSTPCEYPVCSFCGYDSNSHTCVYEDYFYVSNGDGTHAVWMSCSGCSNSKLIGSSSPCRINQGVCTLCNYVDSYELDYITCFNGAVGFSSYSPAAIRKNTSFLKSNAAITTKEDGTITFSGWAAFSNGGLHSITVEVLFEGGNSLLFNSSSNNYPNFSATLSSLTSTHVNSIGNHTDITMTGDYKPNGIYSFTLDLSDYPGQKFSVLIYANTVYGSDVVQIAEIRGLSVFCSCTNTFLKYSSVGDGTHIANNTCMECGKIISSSPASSCEFVNGTCKYCDYYECQHDGEILTRVEPKGDNKHYVITYCKTCEEILYSVVNDCNFVNLVCASCGATKVNVESEPTCSHVNTYSKPFSNADGTHVVIVFCSDCGDDVSSSPSMTCTFYEKVCTVCGYIDVRCEHTEVKGIYVSDKDGSHRVSVICVDCGEEVNSSEWVYCTYEEGVCKYCEYRIGDDTFTDTEESTSVTEEESTEPEEEETEEGEFNLEDLEFDFLPAIFIIVLVVCIVVLLQGGRRRR